MPDCDTRRCASGGAAKSDAEGVAIALDIGGTKIAVGIVDENARLLFKSERPTRSFSGPSNAIDFVVKELLRAGASSYDLRGIGVGCTGPVDAVRGTVGDVAFLPGWNEFPLVEALQAKTKLGVALENDALAAALAEWRWGAGKGADRFVYVSVGTGIGTGVVIDGVPYRGAGGIHPEFGHHSIDESGPECYCGARGCWESLASGPAMSAWYGAQCVPHRSHSTVPTAEQIVALAKAGEPLASRAIEREARYLGIGLANVAAAYAPERIALGGGLMAAWDMFAPVALATASRRGLTDIRGIAIERALLGDDAPLLGAAQIWFASQSGRGESCPCST